MNVGCPRQTSREVQAGMLTRYAYGHGPEPGLIRAGRLQAACAIVAQGIGNVVDTSDRALHFCIEEAGSGKYYIQEQP